MTCGDDEDGPGLFASPPCFMHELDPLGMTVDPQQVRDVARWRKCERERLIAARFAMSAEERLKHAVRVANDLDAFVAIAPGITVSVYWPVRGEPDPRPWMTTLCKKGVRIALPAVAGKGLPLLFSEWQPGAQMKQGLRHYPLSRRSLRHPDDPYRSTRRIHSAGYALGYGGGFINRTPETHLHPRPLAIGVGYPIGSISTIYPQAHDIPMDLIVTGSGALMRRPGL